MFDINKLKKKNICIIGLMGSGKSMIGKDLSKFLKLKFYDTDKEIEIKTNKSISAIFKEEGESYFRSIEEKICVNLLDKNNCVISLGGGSIINSNIRNKISQNSFSIYLQVELNNLLVRLKSSKKRPLLNQNKNKIEILKNLYVKRRQFYEKADITVNNNNDKFQVLEKINAELNSDAK